MAGILLLYLQRKGYIDILYINTLDAHYYINRNMILLRSKLPESVMVYMHGL